MKYSSAIDTSKEIKFNVFIGEQPDNAEQGESMTVKVGEQPDNAEQGSQFAVFEDSIVSSEKRKWTRMPNLSDEQVIDAIEASGSTSEALELLGIEATSRARGWLSVRAHGLRKKGVLTKEFRKGRKASAA